MTTYLKNLKFPVYPLPKNDYKYENNKLIVTTPSLKERIVDDLNIDKDSLGLRRLFIDKSSLYPLQKSVLDIGNFLLYTKMYKHFVDSNGKFFKYEAKTRVPLIYRKIISAIPYKSGTMLIVERTHCPIWYYRNVEEDKQYAVLLRIERGFVILTLATEALPDSTYKI